MMDHGRVSIVRIHGMTLKPKGGAKEIYRSESVGVAQTGYERLFGTHIFLWSVDDDPKLSSTAWSMIEAADAVYVSSASLWEATIKYQLGKLHMEPKRLEEAVSGSGFLELPISVRHAVAISRLPALHQDPFDRFVDCTSHQ